MFHQTHAHKTRNKNTNFYGTSPQRKIMYLYNNYRQQIIFFAYEAQNALQ